MENVNCNFIEGGASLPNGSFIRNLFMKISDITDFRIKYNNRGIYTTAYRYSEENQYESLLDGDLYFDFDHDLVNDEAFEVVKKDVFATLKYLKSIFGIPDEVVDIYFSGKKGIHLVIDKGYIGIEPHSDLNQIFRVIAEEIYNVCPNKTMDMKIYDRRRLWRLGNSQHHESGLYKIPITLDELVNENIGNIKEMAKNQRFLFNPTPTLIHKANLVYKRKSQKINERPKSRKFSKPLKLDVVPPCIEELLNGVVQKGQRNNTAIALASFFRQQGISESDCLAKMENWNESQCSEPLPNREIETTVRQAYRGEYKYGCSGIRTLSTCDKKKCPLVK